MSIAIVKDQIRKFISDEDASVMAIKGDWGVGKTHCWNELLVEAKDKNEIGLKSYSYVSLFGINSLETLKYETSFHTIDTKYIGEEVPLSKILRNPIKTIKAHRRKAAQLTGLADNQINIPFESIAFSTIDRTLVCLDDLERRGEGLSLKDVLGLVSFLKERKNCKVILLLNNGEEGTEDFVKYAEKVVDIELAFSPTAAECSTIAFCNTSDDYKLLRRYSEKLDIRNIRILKRIEEYFLSAQSLLEEVEDEVKEQFIMSLVLFCWSHTSSSSDTKTPPYEFIIQNVIHEIDISEYSLHSPKKKELSPKEKYWTSVLRSYDNYHTKAFDKLIAESVRRGYFIDDMEMLSEIKQMDEITQKNNAQKAYSKTWELYYTNFDVEAEELTSKLRQSFISNISVMDVKNLDGIVDLFKRLEMFGEASELIDIYIDSLDGKSKNFDLMNSGYFEVTVDSEILSKFKEKFSSLYVGEENAEEILKRIVVDAKPEKRTDAIILSKLSAKDFYKLFKESFKGEYLTSYIRACTNFMSEFNLEKEDKIICRNAEEALAKIASENKLNDIRVKRHTNQLQ